MFPLAEKVVKRHLAFLQASAKKENSEKLNFRKPEGNSIKAYLLVVAAASKDTALFGTGG